MEFRSNSLAIPNLSVAAVGVGGDAGLVGKGGGCHQHHQHKQEADTLDGLR